MDFLKIPTMGLSFVNEELFLFLDLSLSDSFSFFNLWK